MIFGTGLDIIEIDRIRKSLEKYSERFEEKVFTQAEIEYCRAQADPARHYAGRFAVKEAVSKCMGTGISGGVAWKDIEVLQKESGQPILKLTQKTKELFDHHKLNAIHITISHARDYAIANAIAEK
jgi:holo-[acyl-carrier protein] synthase